MLDNSLLLSAEQSSESLLLSAEQSNESLLLSAEQSNESLLLSAEQSNESLYKHLAHTKLDRLAVKKHLKGTLVWNSATQLNKINDPKKPSLHRAGKATKKLARKLRNEARKLDNVDGVQ